MASRKLKFGLGFILFWLIPYIAVAALIMADYDPYPNLSRADADAMNWRVNLNGLLIVTFIWASCLAVAVWFSRHPTQSDPPPND